MVALSSIYERVRPMAPRVPDFALDGIARIVFRDFCARTRAYRMALASVAVDPGGAAVALTAPEGFEALCLTDVRLDGRKLYPCAADTVDAQVTGADWRGLPPGTTGHYTADGYDPLQITLLPPSAAGGLLTAMAAVRPSGKFDTVPDMVLQWDHVLASGVKAYLMEMPGTEFTNPEQARVEFNRFDTGCGEVRFAIERGGIDAPARVQMIPFA